MRSRSLRPFLLACTALASITSLAPALAQTASTTATASNETQLQTIVVKGKRVKAGSVADTPLATETTAAEIAQKQITSIEDLGRVAQPGVAFNRSNGAVNIRGLEGARVLTTIDGIPVPYIFDVSRGASGGVDAFNFAALSAVDVMRGADSSRAGSGALGGVLALRTLTPEDLIGEGKDWGGVAKTTYDSSDNSWEGSVAVAKRIDNTSVLFQGSYKKGLERTNQGTIDTYGSTRTKADPSDNDQHNLLFRLQQQLEGGHTLGLTAERFRADRKTDARTMQDSSTYRPGTYTGKKNTDRDRISLDYQYEAQSQDGPISNAWASLYWMTQRTMDGYDGIRARTPIGPIGRENENTERTIGFIGAAQSHLTTGPLEHTLSYGIDAAFGVTKQYSSGYDKCPPPPYAMFATCSFLHTNQADTPKVNSSKLGLYFDDEIQIGSTGLTVTPGLRFDWVKHSPEMTAEFGRNYNKPSLPNGFEDAGFSPKLRVAYDLQPDVKLFGQWAMAFRAPTAGELYSAYGGTGTYLRLGNPGLESETSNGFEFGAELGDQEMGARASVFYNRYKNFIDVASITSAQAAALGYAGPFPMGRTRYSNISDAEMYGVDLSAHKVFENGFRVSAGLAYVIGNDLDRDTFIRSVAPLKVVASVGYDTEFWGVGADFSAVAAARADDGKDTSGASYFRTPGYGIVDLTAWWEPEQAKGLKLTAGVYNVFDRTFFDYSSVRNTSVTAETRDLYSEPGRTFKISLTQKF